MKIRGLGPAAIDKLNINTISEVYELSEDYITVALGSEKLSIKLFDEIQKSKTEPLNVVLQALGIPLIGKTATDKLSKVTSNITEINEVTSKEAGLGPVATSNLIKALNDNDYYLYLPFDMKFENKSNEPEKGVVCITGKLISFKSRAEASKALEAKGYIVKDSITKEVTILLNESGIESAKTEKARKSGLKIITNIGEL